MSLGHRQISQMLASLERVTFDYQGASHPFGIEPDQIGTLTWSVTAQVTTGAFDDDDWISAPDVGLNAVQDEGDESQSRSVFHMEGLTVDLWDADLFDALDAHSADTAHFLALAEGEREAGGLNPELGDMIEGLGSQLVIVDRALVATAWRGLGGVGRLLAASALHWIAAEAQCVAVHPFPFLLAGLERDDPQVVQALDGVRRTWQSIGFERFRDDLYVFDPTSNKMDQEIARLKATLAIGRR